MNKEEGYPVKTYDRPVKRYCRCIEISDNPELIRRYREVHNKEKHWKEIRDGIRQVGILEMEMYIAGSKVFMIMDTEMDFDWKRDMARLSTLPRQAEWENFVSELQGCDPNATSAQKWTLMDRMFYLYED